jgi:competence protein ComEA
MAALPPRSDGVRPAPELSSRPDGVRPAPELPPRPRPARSAADRAREAAERVVEQLRWFGIARAIGAALCIAAAGVGSFWLVRTPAPPIEASLPRATAPSSSAAGPLAGGSAADTDVGTSASEGTGSPSDPASSAASGGAATDDPTANAEPAAAVEIVVHVAGAVALPGVYRLVAGARVVDALAAAGGPAADADTDAVNLAQVLRDGDRVVVPSLADGVAVVPGVSGSGSSAGGAGQHPTDPAAPVDLNRADAAALEALPGIGPATATAIIAHRDEHGPFASVDDLADVPGIGPAKLDALAGLVTV